MIDVAVGTGLDVAAIMPVMDNAFDPHFGEAWTAAQCLSTLAMPGGQLLIAMVDGTVAGFALSRAILDEEELLLIGVVQSTRRRGTGKQLIDKLCEIANKNGRSTIFLEVREGNSAQSFYTKMGFKPIGRRKEYYKSLDGTKYESITMAINL